LLLFQLDKYESNKQIQQIGESINKLEL